MEVFSEKMVTFSEKMAEFSEKMVTFFKNVVAVGHLLNGLTVPEVITSTDW
ncbi:hypothetical protein [Bacteroides sedimenti]|uniref:hypothetical protein n=1 Tax=Bacteroides sedimenti TaxID=2136147 RepID=UPI0033412E6B